MIYLDLLYPSKGLREEGRKVKSVGERLVEDLCLHELVCNDLMSKKDFEQLCAEIDYLPVDDKIIEYRQEVLEDFINNPRFVRSFLDVCEKLQFSPQDKKYSRYQAALHDKLKDYIELVKYNLSYCLKAILWPTGA